jgi:hypothetical protein
VKKYKAVLVLAALATLWLTPITPVPGQGDQRGIVYAGTGPTEPPFNDQDTTVTPPPPSAEEPTPEEATTSSTSLAGFIVDVFLFLLR